MKHHFFLIVNFLFFLVLTLIPHNAFALQAEAVLGEPFGVCRIELPLSPTEQELIKKDHDRDVAYAPLFEILYQASVYESSKRALYPTWSMNTAEDEGYHRKAMLFLFNSPDELNIILSRTGFETLREEIKITPVQNKERHKELVEEWWDAHLMKLEHLHVLDLYDPTVELGIASMMGRRLGLPLNNLTSIVKKHNSKFDRAFGILLGTESIRLAMQTNTMLRTEDRNEPADQNLPKPASIPPMPIPPFDATKVKIEPLAMRVPQECFYLRFGSFSSFLDARNFLDDWGMIFRSILSSRSVDYDIAKRLEHQLALKETVLSRYFGGAVIKDTAIIGTDTFLREGASIGILFQASKSGLLKKQLESIRVDIMAENPSIQESSVNIDGRAVSLLSSPGNAVRSFYVQDGDFHLITTSKWMVEAFLATVKTPEHSLGNLEEFRYARSQINPSAKGIFIYMSDPFFRNLVGPAYRVEMTRRAHSIAEINMLSLSRLAALQEGIASPSIPSMVEKGFLPQGFGMRHDGSQPTAGEDGTAMDSKRGAVGSFLPIPDITIDKITLTEAEAYEDFAEAYSGIWTNMDPVFGLLNINKKPTGNTLELKLSISPYAKSRYGGLDGFLGEPAPDRIATVTGDLAFLEVQLHKNLLSKFDLDMDDDNDNDGKAKIGATAKKQAPKSPSLRLFGGLRDVNIPWSIQNGTTTVGPNDWKEIAISFMRFYVGMTMPSNFKEKHLEILKPVTKPDTKGYAKLAENMGFNREGSSESELWSRRFSSFYLLGTGRPLLEAVSPKIRIEKASYPSQIALTLGDINKSRVGNLLRAQAYVKDRRTSAGNALLLHAYQQQLQPQDLNAALKAVQNQVLTCPLGGNFIPADQKNQPDRWKSTAWSEETLYQVNQLPKTYRQTILDEMTSMRLEFSIDPDTLKSRLEIKTKK